MDFSIQEELIKELYRNAIAGLMGQVLSALAMISIYFSHVPDYLLLGWSLGFVLVIAIRGLSVLIYQRKKKTGLTPLETKKWLNLYKAGVFLTSILWGSLPFLFANQLDNIDYYFLMMAVVFGLTGTAIATLGIIFSVYALFAIPMTSMLAYALMSSDKPIYAIAGSFTLIGMFFLLYTAFTHSKRSYDLLLKNKEIERTQLDIIERLAKAGEFRDGETGEHIKRMSYSSYLLAREYGFSEARAKKMLLASTMHDIGKIGIPDYILLKPGKLNPVEWDIMQTHTTIGAKILCDHDSELLQMAAKIAGNHHEKWNGSGYPQGLAKSDIPIEARIVSICDVFDALTSERPYKKAWSVHDALTFIKTESGQFFDPHLVKLFLSISNQVVNYNTQYRDKIAA